MVVSMETAFRRYPRLFFVGVPDSVLPWLYLKGVSTNDFDEALEALFGKSARGLSPATIGRLKRVWEAEYAEWRQREWHGDDFV